MIVSTMFYTFSITVSRCLRIFCVEHEITVLYVQHAKVVAGVNCWHFTFLHTYCDFSVSFVHPRRVNILHKHRRSQEFVLEWALMALLFLSFPSPSLSSLLLHSSLQFR